MKTRDENTLIDSPYFSTDTFSITSDFIDNLNRLGENPIKEIITITDYLGDDQLVSPIGGSLLSWLTNSLKDESDEWLVGGSNDIDIKYLNDNITSGDISLKTYNDDNDQNATGYFSDRVAVSDILSDNLEGVDALFIDQLGELDDNNN